MEIQKEHVQYALNRCRRVSDPETEEFFFRLGCNPMFLGYFTNALKDAREDDYTNELISERILEQKRNERDGITFSWKD